jgi:hypothetical protein
MVPHDRADTRGGHGLHGTDARERVIMATVKVERSVEEIVAEIDKLGPLTDDNPEADAAYEALRWVIGYNSDAPSAYFAE